MQINCVLVLDRQLKQATFKDSRESKLLMKDSSFLTCLLHKLFIYFLLQLLAFRLILLTRLLALFFMRLSNLSASIYSIKNLNVPQLDMSGATTDLPATCAHRLGLVE